MKQFPPLLFWYYMTFSRRTLWGTVLAHCYNQVYCPIFLPWLIPFFFSWFTTFGSSSMNAFAIALYTSSWTNWRIKCSQSYYSHCPPSSWSPVWWSCHQFFEPTMHGMLLNSQLFYCHLQEIHNELASHPLKSLLSCTIVQQTSL
jgi:hypothetical protein